MTKLTPTPAGAVLVAIDMSKNRQEVLIERLERSYHVVVETSLASGLSSTLVDPSQLENALLNLCINARDAMPDGGRIMIETQDRFVDERAGRERDIGPGHYVCLSVSDTGTGMPPEVIAKAFEPFFTTKPIGSGTGLAFR